MRCLGFAVGFLLSLSACATGGSVPPPVKLPYPAWYIGFAAPKHMEVWVESVDVLDQRGYVFLTYTPESPVTRESPRAGTRAHLAENPSTTLTYQTNFFCAGSH
ncbi:DUF2931 family protein [Pseudomonas graminis]|uniref:DUF2931 family protein n=1 Tax=Pseudomonas graminis TaxID=158627 RepID=UPI0024467678|nr:DUF2931 family protein [Pseudomonas graminis]